jgi:hypothetical protein
MILMLNTGFLKTHSRFIRLALEPLLMLERMKTETLNWSNQWLMISMLNTDFLKTHSRFDGLALEPLLMLEPIKSINIELAQPIAHDLDAKH